VRKHGRAFIGDESVTLNPQGLFIAGYGLVMVTEVMVNVAEAVESSGLADVVSQLTLRV
jgi:hypothetical protein